MCSAGGLDSFPIYMLQYNTYQLFYLQGVTLASQNQATTPGSCTSYVMSNNKFGDEEPMERMSCTMPTVVDQYTLSAGGHGVTVHA